MRGDTGPMGDLWPSKAAGASQSVTHKNIWNGTRPLCLGNRSVPHVSTLLSRGVVGAVSQCCLLHGPLSSWFYPTAVRDRWLLLQYCSSETPVHTLTGLPRIFYRIPCTVILESSLCHCNDTVNDAAQRTSWIHQRHLCVPSYYSWNSFPRVSTT